MADVKAGPDEKNIYPSLMSIGKNCVSYIARDRPEMEQVLRKLDCVMLQDNLPHVLVNVITIHSIFLSIFNIYQYSYTLNTI